MQTYFNVLNLYAGIGGNRKLWPDKVFINGKCHIVKVTAVEIDYKVAEIYKHLFPNDNIIVGDATNYLTRHYDEFDFIWASPPCQSHSILNYVNNATVRRKDNRKLPDMTLYAEILFLTQFYRGIWVVENVRPYYRPLIAPTFTLDRHLFWSNKFIMCCNNTVVRKDIKKCSIRDLSKIHGIDIKKYKHPNKRQLLRNCVVPEIGNYIFEKMIGE